MRYRLLALGLSMLLGLCLMGVVIWSAPVRVNAPFTVNSTIDEIDAAPGDGVCVSTPSGNCTLRAAIMEANALAGDDVISLPAGIYTLTLPGVNEDAGLMGDLDITSTMTIEGAGTGSTVITTTGQLFGDRVMEITGTANVDIKSLTLGGGQGPCPCYAALTLTNSVVPQPRQSSGIIFPPSIANACAIISSVHQRGANE